MRIDAGAIVILYLAALAGALGVAYHLGRAAGVEQCAQTQ